MPTEPSQSPDAPNPLPHGTGNAPDAGIPGNAAPRPVQTGQQRIAEMLDDALLALLVQNAQRPTPALRSVIEAMLRGPVADEAQQEFPAAAPSYTGPMDLAEQDMAAVCTTSEPIHIADAYSHFEEALTWSSSELPY